MDGRGSSNLSPFHPILFEVGGKRLFMFGYERYGLEALERHLYFLCCCLYGKVSFTEFADLCVSAWMSCKYPDKSSVEFYEVDYD